MDQKTVVHIHNGILHSRKKEGTPTFCHSMDGTGEYYIKWNKPGVEDKYQKISPIRRTMWTKQTNVQNRTRGMETKNRLAVTRGKGRGA